jgi:hypothetical protein
MDLEVVIKLSPKVFEKLRAAIPAGSKVAEALDSATPIDYAVDGVTFSGYEIRCSYEEAQLLHGVAREYCPEASFDLEKAIKISSAGRT